jgi:hypothetical protein
MSEALQHGGNERATVERGRAHADHWIRGCIRILHFIFRFNDSDYYCEYHVVFIMFCFQHA